MDNKNTESKSNGMMTMSYQKFSLMLFISLIIMYVVMFLNIAELNHYYTSLTRIYMVLLMVAPMAVVMMLMMAKMYPDKKLNMGIIIGAVLVFIVTLIGLRSQTPIADVQFMKAMIPHHSSAILVSERANLKDPEVRKLADEIIKAQEREIAQMKAILARME